jgi:hypothetical protein
MDTVSEGIRFFDDTGVLERVLVQEPKTPLFKWEFPADGTPLLLPLENYAVKVKETGEILLCEEYEITELLDKETLEQTLNILLNLQIKFLLEYLQTYALGTRINHPRTLKIFSKYTNKTNLKSRIRSQGRSYPPPSELYSIYTQLRFVLRKIYQESIYTGVGLKTKRILFPFPCLSPTAVYLFGKESYKIGLSTVFYYGNESIERFTCPDILMKDRTLCFPEDDFAKGPESVYQGWMAYSIGAILVYYSTLKEPVIFPKEQETMGVIETEKVESMEEELDEKHKAESIQFVTLDMFDKSGTLKKTNQTQPNPYNSVQADTVLIEDMNDKIKKMIRNRDGKNFFNEATANFQEHIFSQYVDLYEHTVYYAMTMCSDYKRSLEETIRDNIKMGGYAPDYQMGKFRDMILAIGKRTEKFVVLLPCPKTIATDTLVYNINIKLDDKNQASTGAKDDTKQKSIVFEITTLFKKNCLIVKAFIDNLSLSVEFGDDLTYLSSLLSHVCPFMSAEMDEQRRIVFRVANTLNSFESFLDPLIHTIDLITITAISIFKKLGDCIKQEKFGKIAKTSKQIIREIEHKIALYTEYKNKKGAATTVIGPL